MAKKFDPDEFQQQTRVVEDPEGESQVKVTNPRTGKSGTFGDFRAAKEFFVKEDQKVSGGPQPAGNIDSPGGDIPGDKDSPEDNLNLPESPTGDSDVTQGTDNIREEEEEVKTTASEILERFDQQTRASTNELKSELQDLKERSKNIGELTEAEKARIEQAGEAAAQQFEAPIARATESARQGTADALVRGGQRGGFMSTQIAGAAAVSPTKGDTFAGRGGEVSKVKGQLEANIAELESAQRQARQNAEQALRTSILTGKRADLDTAVDLLNESQEINEMRNSRIKQLQDMLKTEQEIQQADVEFGQEQTEFEQGQADRALEEVNTILNQGGEVPPELQQEVESRFGEGFIEDMKATIEAEEAAAGQEDALERANTVSQILNRIPEGQQIQIGDAVYEGIADSDPNTRTFKEEDAAGNVTFVTVDEETGEIVKTASGGRIGSGRASSGGDDSTPSDEEAQSVGEQFGLQGDIEQEPVFENKPGGALIGFRLSDDFGNAVTLGPNLRSSVDLTQFDSVRTGGSLAPDNEEGGENNEGTENF